MRELPAEVLEILGRNDSPTICNVIELCNVRPRNAGYLTAGIRAVYPDLPPMVGYAVTVTFRSSTAASPDEKPLGLVELIRQSQMVPAPRVLVVQDLDDPPDGAVYGEIVATTLKAFGFAGLVTNGYARDVDPVGRLAFPCFTAGNCASHAYCRWLSTGQPVNVGGVTVRPGELIHGDNNGVTSIPFELAERIASGCKRLADTEDILLRAAKEPGVTVDRFAEAMKQFVARQSALAQELSGQAPDKPAGI